jgi:hypothetical protein
VSEVAQHWINGDWTNSASISESINPATGETMGQWYDGGAAEARAAVAAARHAFETTLWSRDRNLRNQALNEMAERFDARAEELGPLVTSGPTGGCRRGTRAPRVGVRKRVFGDFRYKSRSLGKVVTSPFAILVKVVDGQVTYLQFLEDSYATASSFRERGSWTVQTEPGADPFEV